MYKDEQYKNQSIDFTILDKARIEDIESGEEIVGESGNFKVTRLNKQYLVDVRKNFDTQHHVFNSLEKLFEYLENN